MHMTKTLKSLTFVLVFATLVLSRPVSAAGGPIEGVEKKAFTVVERDTLKKIKGLRYLRSNESELQLFAPHIKNLGYGYVGVGADQNYTMMAMAQPSHVWLMDYDPWVTRLHFIYRALFLVSPTAPDFIKLWRDRDKVRALLRKHYGSTPNRLARMLWIYKRYRSFLRPYLGWAFKRKRSGAGTTWLSNPVYYKRVRTLWQEGRIQPLSGDLHGTQVLQGISRAAKRLKIAIRIVYLSNAEMYLPFTKQFIANMNAVPWDDKSLLVRTVRGKRYVMKSDKWHYNIQPFGKDYLRRLATGHYRRIHSMMKDFERTSRKTRRALQRPRGFSRFTPDVMDYTTFLARMQKHRDHKKRWRRRRKR
jgi:hypothetical protein